MKSLLFFLSFLFSINNASAQTFNQLSGLLAQTKKTRCESFSSNWTPGMNSNIVGYWKMDGALGAIANGAAVPATVGSNATMNGTTSSYVAGVLSQGISFSGVNADNNYLTIGTPAALNDLSTMTLMAWIKVPANTNTALFYKSDGNSSKGWFFYIDTDYRFYFAVVRASSNIQYKVHNTTASIAGTWAQVVVTWDGVMAASGVHVYVNGIEWTTTGSGYTQDGSGLHNTDAAEPFYIGNRGSGTDAALNFKGEMDEAAVWNKALSAAEVAHLYKNQKCN